MDYSYADVENPDKFPPKRIWVWWDMSGELMDTSDRQEDGEYWAKTNENVYTFIVEKKVGTPFPWPDLVK